MFDWVRFLDQRGIHYITEGANTAKGNISIQCPFCGPGDRSQHLGIALNGAGWSCWRNREHRGRRPQRLVQALLRCTWEEANRICGSTAEPTANERTWNRARIEGNSAKRPNGQTAKPLAWPKEMKLVEDYGAGRHFADYLHSRGYDYDDVNRVGKLYDLRGTLLGPYRYRLIIPVYMPFGLAGWTARAIAGQEPRYKALSADPEKAAAEGMKPAPLPIDETLWNLDRLLKPEAIGAKVLVVNEGPLDAMRVDFLGRPNVRATCIFGKRISDAQIVWLRKLAPLYERRLLMLDPDARAASLRQIEVLKGAGFEVCGLPEGFDDPAELDFDTIRALTRPDTRPF